MMFRALNGTLCTHTKKQERLPSHKCQAMADRTRNPGRRIAKTILALRLFLDIFFISSGSYQSEVYSILCPFTATTDHMRPPEQKV